MIVTKTPLRISFLGGGTDYPDYFKHHGGETLATSIDSYTLVVVNRLTKFVDYRIRVHYSQVESVDSLDELRHPSARECLRFSGLEEGVEIHYISDLPARTGLGSSSSATVGLLQALYGFKGQMVAQERVAAEATHIEQECIGERVGSQDQYICAVGGLRHLVFYRDGTVGSTIVILPPERKRLLQQSLMLLYTGRQRTAHEVLAEQIDRTRNGLNTNELHSLKLLAAQGVEILTGSGDLRQFGELLHEGWMLKRQLSSRISDGGIDALYERARAAGALGGKLLGAGAGGFLLLFVEPSKRETSWARCRNSKRPLSVLRIAAHR